MRYGQGQSLNEYGVILALAVVISIPALASLGGTLNKGFKNLDPSQSGMSQLVGLVSPANGNAGNAASPASPASPASSAAPAALPAQHANVPVNLNGQPMAYSFDPNTGIMTISTGNGANSTSVDGVTATLAVAAEMERWVEENAQTLPEDKRNLIMALVNRAYEIAEKQHSYDLEAKSIPGSHYSIGSFKDNYENLVGSYHTFINETTTSLRQIGSPRIQELSALISTITFQNYLQPSAVNSVVQLAKGEDPSTADTTRVDQQLGVTNLPIPLPHNLKVAGVPETYGSVETRQAADQMAGTAPASP